MRLGAGLGSEGGLCNLWEPCLWPLWFGFPTQIYGPPAGGGIHGCRAPGERLLRSPGDERMRTAAHSAGHLEGADLGLEEEWDPCGGRRQEGVPANRSPQGLLCTCEAGRPWEVRGAWQGGAESLTPASFCAQSKRKARPGVVQIGAAHRSSLKRRRASFPALTSCSACGGLSAAQKPNRSCYLITDATRIKTASSG